MNPMLAGKRVMIVEDEKILAAVLDDALQLSGAMPPTVCFDPERALSALASENFDAAILDVALGRRDSYAVADELRHRHIPFAFATASDHLPEAYRDVPHLRKPYDYEELLRCVAALCATRQAATVQS
jgi:CheY-like chemotaxis protein